MNKSVWLEEVEAIIEKHLYMKKEGDEYNKDIFVDYDEKYLSKETVKEIFEAENPRQFFSEKIWEWEGDQRHYELEYVEGVIKQHMEEETKDLYWDEIEVWIEESFHFYYNESDFTAEVLMDIIVDTGDGNSDFTLNCVSPHYNCTPGEIIDNDASILWLAKQQGYKKSQLNKALRNQEYSGSKFMESMYEEVANCTSHMNALVFMVNLSLDEAFDLVEQFNAEAELNDSYTFSERKGRGYMTLKKTTKCGLYDPWMGAGSLLELELEKDVKLHFKCVDSILPDGGRGYSISEIYGMCESAWISNAVTLVHPMEKTA